MDIGILGCGWLGSALAVSLIHEGHRVNGSTTSPEKLNTLTSKGIKPFVIDIENRDEDFSKFLNVEVLIIAITSKNLSGFQSLVHAMKESRIKKVLFVSSTSVYPLTNNVVTEQVPTLDSPLAQIESLFTNSPNFVSTIIRFAGLFGYDRKPGNFFKAGRVIDHPEGYVNMIHRDDCIGIIEEVINQNAWGETFNACCDSHPTRREYYTHEAKKVGRTDLSFNEQASNDYKIISNKKLKQTLNYSFQFNDLMEIE